MSADVHLARRVLILMAVEFSVRLSHVNLLSREGLPGDSGEAHFH
jgi:hypothetical protein